VTKTIRPPLPAPPPLPIGHTWTAVDGEFNSGSLAEGESFDFTFDEAGEFDYFCSIHSEMQGSITVEG